MHIYYEAQRSHFVVISVKIKERIKIFPIPWCSFTLFKNMVNLFYRCYCSTKRHLKISSQISSMRKKFSVILSCSKNDYISLNASIRQHIIMGALSPK